MQNCNQLKVASNITTSKEIVFEKERKFLREIMNLLYTGLQLY